jgi:UbiD family decarboxylase
MRDLRDWLAAVDAIGELRVVRGASWEEDVGAVTELLDAEEGSPAVLFDEVSGYPAGHRILVNANGTPRRQAVTLGLPEPARAGHEELLEFWRNAIAGLEPVEPVQVETAPVFDGSADDLGSFPAPVWHPEDGGRFLGTACIVALRDPDEGWVNYGTYRQQVFARDELGLYITLGHHGRTILDRWAERNERCPVVSVVGADPLLFMAACAEGIGFGTNELAWAGGLRGEPVAVVEAPLTGLPVPASAEIAIEGYVEPGATRLEGPYGEWHGYYSESAAPAPVVKVEAIHHRAEPILLGCPQGKPPHEDNRFLAYLKSALAEQQLRAAGVPGVKAVWCPPELGNRLLVVIAIEQSHPGHAKQAGLVGGQVAATVYSGRFVVVVDDDVDVFDLNDVLWALGTRCDPRRDATIVEGAWSSRLDLAVDPAERGRNSRLILDATRPWERRNEFPQPIRTKERARAIRDKWGWLLDNRRKGSDKEAT